VTACGSHVLDTSAQESADSQKGHGAGVAPTRNTAHIAIDSHLHNGGVAPTRKRGEKANWNDNTVTASGFHVLDTSAHGQRDSQMSPGAGVAPTRNAACGFHVLDTSAHSERDSQTPNGAGVDLHHAHALVNQRRN